MRRYRLLAVLSLSVLFSTQVQAKTFHCRAGDVQCLIAVMNDANASGKTNEIRLEAGTYTLTVIDNIIGPPSFEGANGLPSITSTLTITGAGADTTIIERATSAPRFRLIHVAAAGTLTLKDLTLTGGAGGGLGSNFPFQGTGGGIFNWGVLTLTNSTLANSHVTNGLLGGGLFNSGGMVTIANSTLTHNGCGFGCKGGGLATIGGQVTISHSTFADNVAGDGGGGLYGGPVTISHSTFADNFVGEGSGGGLQLFKGTILNSTITGNTANFGSGGGLSGGPVTILNSTITGNSANFSGVGGGLWMSGTIINSTITGNSASDGRGGGGVAGSPVTLQNSILALNTTFIDPLGRPVSPDCFGPVTSLGNNVVGDPSGCTITLQPSDLMGNPGLGPFTDDGTPGNGHFPLLPTSQAINAGNEEVCPKRDQLEEQRHKPCDIGAIEFKGKVMSSQ